MAQIALQVVVSPLLEVVFDNLASLIDGEFRLLRGVNKDLEKLSSTFSTIRDVLEFAEEKQVKDNPTRNWLRKLKDAAYLAEDVLEECELEALRLASEDIGDMTCTEQVSDSFSACFDFKQIMFRHKMGRKIKDTRDKFDEIAAERTKFHLSPGVASSGAVEEVGGCSRETSSFLVPPVIFGRDEDKENIVKMLLYNSHSQNNVSICPILGIGGLGKTTLAQIVYNDERVVNQFDVKIWICVSDDFGVKRIIKMIIDHLLGTPCDLVDLDPMQNHLKRLLYGKKFLLVLDDVWDENRDNWAKFRYLLTCGRMGSSIIVTTRLETVVDSITCLQTGTESVICVINPSLQLKFLSEDDCWSLFKHCAFGMGNEEDQSLMEIGQAIVRKCAGVPLAVKTLGSLLYNKRWESWRIVRDSEIWSLGETTILPALRVNYYHLTPQMRQCFAYCSVYPKDARIHKDQLIGQWIANGFVQSRRENEVEDIGDEIFNGLLQRCFFQNAGENQFGIFINMHDLMHDLAQSVTGNECSIMKMNGMEDIPQAARHASLVYESHDSPIPLHTLPKPKPFLRTLTFIGNSYSRINAITLDHSLTIFSRAKGLRVLDLQCCWTMKSLPSWIGHLKHLRYLNLGYTDIASLPTSVCGLRNLQILLLHDNPRLRNLPPSIKSLKKLRCLDLSLTSIKVLPESICSLTNLQTLDLRGCSKLKMLPKKMGNMKSLRHLKIQGGYTGDMFRGGMPVGIGELTRLESLGMFVVHPPTDNNSEYGAGVQELETLNQHKGSLIIKGLRHVDDPSDAQKANLRSKNKLSQLQLLWSYDSEEYDETESWQGVENITRRGEEVLEENIIRRSEEVLQGLQPHPNIQKLRIDGYPGVVLPSWVRDVFLKLTALKLYGMPNVEGCSSESEEPVFPPFLETLLISRCPKLKLHTTTKLPSSIKRLGVERSNDPWLSSIKTLPHLSLLRIGGFDEHKTLPEAPLRNLTRLQELRIYNCGKLKRLPTELGNLATLRRLRIMNCGELDSMTEKGLQNLTSLEELWILDCRSLKSLSESSSSLQHLASLDYMTIWGCPDLEFSVVDFQHLASLRLLRLATLPHLTCLPEGIQHATTLQHLEISHCKNLRMLPEWLQYQLPVLYSLHIIECHPDLHRRCEKDKGKDWHKISHLRVLNEESFSR